MELPYLIVQASAYALLTYFMIGFEMNVGEQREPGQGDRGKQA